MSTIKAQLPVKAAAAASGFERNNGQYFFQKSGRYFSGNELLAWGHSPELGRMYSLWLDRQHAEKKADSWLQRWLSMFAARDAAHQADPTRDAATTKLLSPLTPFGVPEAINNHAILGSTPAERREAMHDAVRDVKDDTYTGAFLRGLKSSPSYVLAGAGVGALTPAVKSWAANRPQDLRGIGLGAGAGAATGLTLSLLRPVIQKLILDNTSAKAQRKAIEMKAEHPVLTALPLGDMIGAAKAARHGVNRFNAAKLREVLSGTGGKKPDSEFPKRELEKGIEHEKEHTSVPSVAKVIAKDHIDERKDYYTELEKVLDKE